MGAAGHGDHLGVLGIARGAGSVGPSAGDAARTRGRPARSHRGRCGHGTATRERGVRTKRLWTRLGGSRHNAGLALLTTALFVTVAARYPQFASAAGLRDSFDDTSILILLALGQMLVMLTRAIDLSVAANVALTGMCVALINQAMPVVALPWLVLSAALLGAALGAVNGLLVWQLQIPPIVVTLGTLAIYRGATY